MHKHALDLISVLMLACLANIKVTQEWPIGLELRKFRNILEALEITGSHTEGLINQK